MPWIKLHKKLPNDWGYGELRASEQLMFIHMLLMADSVSNRFPLDPKWMRTRLQVDAQWIFANFESKGLIEIIGSEKNEDCPSRREEKRIEDINNAPDDLDILFEEDWLRYPRKEGNKAKAKKSWMKTVGGNVEKRRPEFHAKMDEQVNATPDKKYLPYASTFFHQWQDLKFDKEVTERGFVY